jgi:hypothetical protein
VYENAKIEGTQLLQQNNNLDLRAVLVGKYAGMYDNYVQCLSINACRDFHMHQPWDQLESTGIFQAAWIYYLHEYGSVQPAVQFADHY